MISKAAGVLKLAPLVRQFRQKIESGELALEEAVRNLAWASELVALKLRWLLPGARQEEPLEEEVFEDEDGTAAATAIPTMEPWEVATVAKTVENLMKSFALMFPRGSVPPYETGRRLEIVAIERRDLTEAMLAVERRAGASKGAYVVSRWSFVSHLRSFWREVRRLTSRGAVIRFSRFLGRTKQEAILNFLAFLELVRRRRVFARQRSLFGDIELSTTKETVEREEDGAL